LSLFEGVEEKVEEVEVVERKLRGIPSCAYDDVFVID
jgi:hypothetical protein